MYFGSSKESCLFPNTFVISRKSIGCVVEFCYRNNNRSACSHQLRRHEAQLSTDDCAQSGTSFSRQGLYATVSRSYVFY